MGNSKDGKLGIPISEGCVDDFDLPEKVKSRHKIRFFLHKVIQTITKQYPLFDDYDEYSKLKPVFTKNLPFEVN